MPMRKVLISLKDLLEIGQKPGRCHAELIGIPVDLFKKIAPTQGDLNWLTPQPINLS